MKDSYSNTPNVRVQMATERKVIIFFSIKKITTKGCYLAFITETFPES